jgi:glutathione synthase/RimK-type ligase-like ATP-grasp enzyme
VNGTYYLQEFVPAAQAHHQDWRLFVCAGTVIAAMIRHGTSWITNIKQGARAKAAIASQELIDLAVRSAGCVGADYAGVDIIQAPDGRFLVLEVNSMPAWNGLQRVSRLRISDHVVDAFLDAALPPARRKTQEEA